MLYDNRENLPDLRYRRQTVPLDPERLATGETPFNEAVERYVFTGFDDFSGGARAQLDRIAAQPRIGQRVHQRAGMDDRLGVARAQLVDGGL